MLLENKFDFTTNQGLNASVEVNEGKDGLLIINKFDVGNININTHNTTKGLCLFERIYDKNSDKKIFCITVTREPLRNFLNISNINKELERGHIKLNNADLENLYLELPKVRTRELKEKADTFLFDNLDLEIDINEYCGSFYNHTHELKHSKKFNEIISNLEKYEMKNELKQYETAFDKYTISLSNLLRINDLALEKKKIEENRKLEKNSKTKSEIMELTKNIEEFKSSKVFRIDNEYNREHTIVFKNGNIYIWNERNIFDFGTVFNPLFEIERGIEGGLVQKGDDNKYYFKNYTSDKGWYKVRELTNEELESYILIKKISAFGDLVRL